jgi:hypothetical protein
MRLIESRVSRTLLPLRKENQDMNSSERTQAQKRAARIFATNPTAEHATLCGFTLFTFKRGPNNTAIFVKEECGYSENREDFHADV